MSERWLICTIVSLSLLVAGCASDFTGSQGPTIKNINVPSDVPTSTYHILSATTDSTEAEIEFDSDGGEIEADYNEEAKWLAPDEKPANGEIEIIITASHDGNIKISRETVTIKEPKIVVTDIQVGTGGQNPVEVALKCKSSKDAETIELTFLAWGKNDQPIFPQNSNHKYKTTDTFSVSFTDNTYTINNILAAQYFKSTPEEIHAYVSWIEYDDGTEWSLEE